MGLHSTLTPGIVFLALLLTCVLGPAMVLFGPPPSDELPRRGKAIRFWLTLLGGLPMIAILGWDSLGIPPSQGAWLVNLLFFAAMAMSLPAVAVASILYTRGPLTVVPVTIGYVLLILAQAMAPPLYVLLANVYSYERPTVPTSLEPDNCKDGALQPIFAHISDLHITDEPRTRDGREPGNRKLALVIQRINEYKPAFLIVSGDITDKGTAEQWRLVDALLDGVDRTTKIIISTGNHDLNHFFGEDPDEHPWTWFGFRPLVGIDAEPRVFRAADFQARHLKDIRTSDEAALSESVFSVPNKANLSSFKRQIGECISSCVMQPVPGDSQLGKLAAAGCTGVCETDLDSIRYHYFHDVSSSFPLYAIDAVTHTAFISMTTSMADSAEVGRNAIGFSGKEQVDNFRSVLSKLPASIKYIVVVQHHPPLWEGVPAPPKLHWLDLLHPRRTWDAFYTSAWFVSVFLHNDVDEGRRVYAMLQAELSKRPGASGIFTFGHRHKRSLSNIGAVTFEEAPNLATTTPDDYGFYLVGTKSDLLTFSWCSVAQNGD